MLTLSIPVQQEDLMHIIPDQKEKMKLILGGLVCSPKEQRRREDVLGAWRELALLTLQFAGAAHPRQVATKVDWGLLEQHGVEDHPPWEVDYGVVWQVLEAMLVAALAQSLAANLALALAVIESLSQLIAAPTTKAEATPETRSGAPPGAARASHHRAPTARPASSKEASHHGLPLVLNPGQMFLLAA